MAQLFSLSGQTLVDGNGAPYAAAKAAFYLTGTTTPQNTYSDAGLSSANTNPVVADANGRFPDIYLSAARYKVVLTTSADVAIDTLDPVDATSQLITAASAPSTTYAFLRYYNTTDGRVYRRNAANSAWINEGPVDSLVNAATVSEVLTGTDATKAVTPDALAGLWQRGTDIASASTLSLPASGGGVFNVTGTTGVTAISSAQGGRTVKFKFASSLTITHNGTSLILPGGVSITTRAGDIAEFTNEAAADASGSNWRLTDYLRNLDPIETPSSAKTTNYTVADTDRNGVIRFSGMSSDSTLTLPAASGRAGFRVTLLNLDGVYGVTVDGNASETIDTFTTRKTFGTEPITLFCDGSAWHTIGGQWMYRSTQQTVSSAGGLTLAHGLGVVPSRVDHHLVCLSAEAGYSTNDIATSFQDGEGGFGGAGLGCTFDSTNVVVRYGSNATPLTLRNKTTGAIAVLTNANWALVVKAWS